MPCSSCLPRPRKREPCDSCARSPISKAICSARDGRAHGGNAHVVTIGEWGGRRHGVAVGNLMCKNGGKGIRLR